MVTTLVTTRSPLFLEETANFQVACYPCLAKFETSQTTQMHHENTPPETGLPRHKWRDNPVSPDVETHKTHTDHQSIGTLKSS